MRTRFHHHDDEEEHDPLIDAIAGILVVAIIIITLGYLITQP